MYLLTACLAMAAGIVTFTIAPNGHVNTRAFSGTTPVHVTISNSLLLAVSLGSFATVWLGVANLAAAFVLALAVSAVALVFLGLDVGGLFPVADQPAPPHVLLLQVADLVLMGTLLIVALSALAHGAPLTI